MMQKVNPMVIQLVQITGGQNTLRVKGDQHVGHIGDISFRDNNGSLVIGGTGNTAINNNYFNDLDKLTRMLLERVDQADLPEQAKHELRGAIDEADKQARAERPNKVTIAGILSSINNMISILKNASELAGAYDKWKALITSIF